jgi:dihydrofolate reductase
MERLVGTQPAVSPPGVRAHASLARAARARGRNDLTFVTDGIEAALERARRVAGGKDVSLAGGANTARQYLLAGLVDEMEINLAPTLLGDGERLFDGVGDDLRGLELVRTVATPQVTHLKFARR